MEDQNQPPSPSLSDLLWIDGAEETVKKSEVKQGKREQGEEYDPYSDEKKKTDFKIGDLLKKTFGILSIVLLVILGVCICAIIIVRVWHIIGLQNRRWLKEDDIKQLDQLVNYIIIGSAGTFVLKYMQKNIES